MPIPLRCLPIHLLECCQPILILISCQAVVLYYQLRCSDYSKIMKVATVEQWMQLMQMARMEGLWLPGCARLLGDATGRFPLHLWGQLMLVGLFGAFRERLKVFQWKCQCFWVVRGGQLYLFIWLQRRELCAFKGWSLRQVVVVGVQCCQTVAVQWLGLSWWLLKELIVAELLGQVLLEQVSWQPIFAWHEAS